MEWKTIFFVWAAGKYIERKYENKEKERIRAAQEGKKYIRVEDPHSNLHTLFIVVECLVGGGIGVMGQMKHWEGTAWWMILGISCVGCIWYGIGHEIMENKNDRESFSIAVMLATVTMIGLNLLVLWMG